MNISERIGCLQYQAFPNRRTKPLSSASCKQALCGWDGITAIDVYMVDVDSPTKALRKAVIVCRDELTQSIDLAQLLSTGAAGGFNREITVTDAHDVIEITETIETQLAGKSPNDAKTFLEERGAALKNALRREHDCVTGETTAY